MGGKSVSELSAYTCTPRQAKALIIECIEAGLVPALHSSPGMGKSSIMKAVAKEFGLFMIDHRLSTSAPEDLTGLPRFRADGFAEFAPFVDMFPMEGMTVPEGYDGWMLFLDEWNAAPRSVQAACFKLILDRMVGQKNLHKNVAICAAGNLVSDKSITNPISTAMQSRVIHLEMRVDFVEWLEDVAIPGNYDKRIIAYLSQYPSKLMDFNPNHNEKTFSSPRTWEFMNKLIKGKEVNILRAPLFTGAITSGVALDFIQFTEVFHTLVSVKDILGDPDGCKIPVDNASRWAVISMMMEHTTDQTFGSLAKYASRFPMDYQILFTRSTMIRHPKMRQHPAFGPLMQAFSRYIHT
jgi:hypothetical protein